MAETNGQTYWNGCDPCHQGNWQSMFHNNDSIRREFSFNSSDLRNHIDSNRNAVDRQYSDLSTQAERNTAALNLAMQVGFSSAQLLANQQSTAILSALATCCCDIKEKIASDGQQTRDLINAIERDRLAVQTSDLKAELLAIKYSSGHGGGSGS